MTTPAAAGWHLPGEGQPHSRCWIAWPEVSGSPPAGEPAGESEVARAALIRLAQTIAGFEPVTILCPADELIDFSLACGPGIPILPMNTGGGRIGDTGPTFLLNQQGALSGVYWREHGTPSDSGSESPAALGRRLLDHLRLPGFAGPLVLVGGAFVGDGRGTLLTTEQWLLDPLRNPGLTKADAEVLLCAYTGADTVIWLGQGYHDDPAGGQVLDVARFVRPGGPDEDEPAISAAEGSAEPAERTGLSLLGDEHRQIRRDVEARGREPEGERGRERERESPKQPPRPRASELVRRGRAHGSDDTEVSTGRTRTRITRRRLIRVTSAVAPPSETTS